MGILRIASAQLNTKVGDVASNVRKIVQAWDNAEQRGCDLVVTPELSISGYPLEDLIENPDLLDSCHKAIEILIEESKKRTSAIIVGAPYKGARLEDGRNVYNTALLIDAGEIKHFIQKQHLPTYDVFDEKRNNAEGPKTDPVEFRGVKLGMMICEDTWFPDVAKDLTQKGAQMIVSINSSPFVQGKQQKRLDTVLRARASETSLPVLYVCQVGGQDEVVFDGASMAVNADGALMYAGPAFEESLDVLEIEAHKNLPAKILSGAPIHQPLEDMESVWKALVTGTRDYLHKNFGLNKEVVLGMSGGIDSALVAAIAADAIGAEKVHLVSMPYRFTSEGTRNDARKAAEMLGAPFEELPIVESVEATQRTLAAHFNPQSNEVANENLQARTRGTILMHISNEHHWLVLSTGNKSEVSVGYCTLYGDMNGGFNPLKDVRKTLAFKLAEWRNHNWPDGLNGPKGPVMPETIITRPPSAELAENQVDSNSLPEYDVLDKILEAYVEQDMSLSKIAENTGFESDLIESVVQKVDIAEFKRRQACPGVKITPRSFGKGRRVPISRPTTPAMVSGINSLSL